MKTKNPQISQLTQIWKEAAASVAMNPQPSLYRLRNLCNLRRNSFQENQWTS